VAGVEWLLRNAAVDRRADPGVGRLILTHMMLKAHTTVMVDTMCAEQMKKPGANRSFWMHHRLHALLWSDVECHVTKNSKNIMHLLSPVTKI
jgi:hypothetical protein